MKREVLVVAIHVGGVGIGNNFIDGDWAFDGFVLLVKHLRNIALQLVTLRLHVLDRETDHRAAYLHCHSVLGLQPKLLLQQDDGAELGSIVLNVKTIMFALDDSVTAANTNIVNSYLTLMTTSKLELGLLRRHGQQVNVS